uniref:Uncharacterized protein n=1 Tax=Oryza brachyantha TaxID=4533 RepID=J3LS11_ORYBR
MLSVPTFCNAELKNSYTVLKSTAKNNGHGPLLKSNQDTQWCVCACFFFFPTCMQELQ